MIRLLLSLLVMMIAFPAIAFNLHGTVTDSENKPLSFCSIIIKGSTIGTTANQAGKYSLQLNPGNYTILCQRVGFKTAEVRVTVENKDVELNFTLQPQDYKLSEVIVKTGSEDPAYEIIRKTIKKRAHHEKELKKYQVDVYIKGQLKLRDYPDKFMGIKVDFEDNDTSKKKMIFLSETVARYSVKEPDRKIEVLSTRVSGSSDGYGLAAPQIVSFYSNNIALGRGLNPRGFISPIADNALNYYRYKFEGSFYENGIEISRIKVIPKRKYEPLFSGYINIIEHDWRLHSVNLTLLKEQQMQFLDTLKIEQIYVPVKEKKTWVIKQQVLYPAIKIFSFDAYGSFLQVYEKFDMDPQFKEGFFDNTFLKFTDSSNKKPKEYWDTTRPIALQKEEVDDYLKKDSLEERRKNPEYLDSLDRRRNKPSLTALFLSGQTFSKEKKKLYVSVDPLLEMISYNTVEGGVIQASPTISKGYENRRSFSITPVLRYGLVNKHFNPSVNFRYHPATKRSSSFSLSGGSKVFQFNNNSALSQRVNTVATLLWHDNLLKIYEARFASAGYSRTLSKGFSLSTNIEYQHRKPLENTSFTSWKKGSTKQFSPNYPTEIASSNIPEHRAFLASVNLSWRPGTRYIEFPDRIVSLGSKYPTLSLGITAGLPGILNADADFTRWRFSVSDNMNFKMGGSLRYKIGAGGFLHKKQLYLPDYTHFHGNVGLVASEYMNSFQLASLYELSNAENLYQFGHIEYHLNGLISNKIPGFRKLNWFFVVGGNGLRASDNAYHYEVFFSIENILKVFRIDFIKGFQLNGVQKDGIRIALPGILRGSSSD